MFRFQNYIGILGQCWVSLTIWDLLQRICEESLLILMLIVFSFRVSAFCRVTLPDGAVNVVSLSFFPSYHHDGHQHDCHDHDDSFNLKGEAVLHIWWISGDSTPNRIAYHHHKFLRKSKTKISHLVRQDTNFYPSDEMLRSQMPGEGNRIPSRLPSQLPSWSISPLWSWS